MHLQLNGSQTAVMFALQMLWVTFVPKGKCLTEPYRIDVIRNLIFNGKKQLISSGTNKSGLFHSIENHIPYH